MGLYRRPDSNHIWACVQHHGVEKRFSTGTDDMRLAENILAKVKVDQIEHKWFDKPKDIRFCDLVAKYMLKYKRQRDPYTVKHLESYFGDMLLSEITPEMVEDYLIDRDESESCPKPATIYQEFSLGRRMFNVARKRWKLVSTNPFADVEFSELLTIDNARERWLTVEEEERLLGVAAPAYLPEIVLFAIHTGCRRGEILELDWDKNIDMHLRTIKVCISKNKPGAKSKYKVIPMSQTLYSMLQRKRNTNPTASGRLFDVSAHALKDAFVRAVEKAGIEDLHFHDLRHTFATRLVRGNVDLYVVQKLMGHKSIKTTERYAHHCRQSLEPHVMVLDSCYGGSYHDFITFEADVLANMSSN